MRPDPYRAYARAEGTGTHSPTFEGLAFAKAARLFAEAAKAPNDGMRQAIDFNRRLWTLVQADVTHPKNTLPAEMKANLLSLSLFMDKRMAEIQAGGGPCSVEAVVAINRSMASAQLSPSD